MATFMLTNLIKFLDLSVKHWDDNGGTTRITPLWWLKSQVRAVMGLLKEAPFANVFLKF